MKKTTHMIAALLVSALLSACSSSGYNPRGASIGDAYSHFNGNYSYGVENQSFMHMNHTN